jgi:hypothetical protein
MIKEWYAYEANTELTRFIFTSDMNGVKISKLINYKLVPSVGRNIYSLEFGDYDETTRSLQVLSISNNGDRDKILNTVALTVLDFFEAHPDCMVIATGSTPARTRLYQMGISKNLHVIKTNLDVYGFTKSEWQPFQSNTNYEAFYVIKTNPNFKK